MIRTKTVIVTRAKKMIRREIKSLNRRMTNNLRMNIQMGSRKVSKVRRKSNAVKLKLRMPRMLKNEVIPYDLKFGINFV